MIVKTAEFVRSSALLSQCPQDNLPEFAVIGRSNVGKSSLINAITNNRHLCKTSSKPGKTQLINHFIINKEWYLVDLPGYGFAKIPMTERKKLDQMIASYIRNRRELLHLFILLDSRHKLLETDSIFIENIIDLGIPFSIVLTKCDKIASSTVNLNKEAMRKAIMALGIEEVNFIPTSAEKKQGVDLFLNKCEEYMVE